MPEQKVEAYGRAGAHVRGRSAPSGDPPIPTHAGRGDTPGPGHGGARWRGCGVRHACGFKLANDGVDTRTIQAYLGHKSIQHTVQARRPTSRRWKAVTSMPMWRPAGPRTLLPARPKARPQPKGLTRQSPRTPSTLPRVSRPCARRSRPVVTTAPTGCDEPVFGHKQGRGFRQFLMRGIEKVRAEWAIICTTHNMLKLAQGRSLSAARPMALEARPAVA